MNQLPPPPIGPFRRRRMGELAKDYAIAIGGYIVDLVAGAFYFNRWIFSFLLAITILWFLLSMMTSQLVYFVRPVCSLPIISPMIPFCHREDFKGSLTHNSGGRPVRWADYPKLVDLQTKTFDKLLDENAGGKGLALQTIEASKTPTSLMARVLQFLLSNINPTEEAVIQAFLMSMDNIATHMVRLRDEAEISMGHLMRLEEHLMVLHEITHRDNKELTAAQEDVLAELWTWLGGNRPRLRKMSSNLDLLKNVEKYRKKALAHVVVTLQVLHALDADMEELRTRVAAPEIAGDRIPIEVHIKSIKVGVERLKEGQMKASLREGESIARILEINT